MGDAPRPPKTQYSLSCHHCYFDASVYYLLVDTVIYIIPIDISFFHFKVKLATQKGIAALLIFPNPEQDMAKGFSNVYPRSWWLPGDAVRRGSILKRLGDPLTPNYPAKGLLLEDKYPPAALFTFTCVHKMALSSFRKSVMERSIQVQN